MINWIKNIVIDILTDLGHKKWELEDIINIVGLMGTVSAVTISGVKLLHKRIQILRQQKPIDYLYKALIGYSVASKVEVIYQIRSYRPPLFKDGKTFKQLFRQIKELSGDKRMATAMFSIIGSPACGKTTTMRYLYCQLSKSRKCVYFQMQHVATMEMLSEYLRKQKLECNLPDQTPVIAFFDGLDEAYDFFCQENPSSMEDAFQTIFFKDPEPKINRIFLENKLDLVCIVISIRPDFLEKSTVSLTSLQRSNVYQKMYEIVGMSDDDVIKIFKSLKILKKLDAKRDLEEQRHQNRYPPRRQAHKYIRLLRNILRDNPNCMFQYPMYIRYAYAFMQQYLARQASGDKITLSNNNISVSFDILVNAIIKWEFHVYYGKSSTKNEEEMERLTYQMEQCAQDMAVQLTKDGKLTRDQLVQIMQKYFQEKISPLIIAHCFMVSDDEDRGGSFTFCHNTFQEYFLAKYLFMKADYAFRKEYFCADVKPKYLMNMYYSILCQDKLNEQISESIFLDDMKYISKDVMTPESYLQFDKETEIELKDNPQISMAEIFEYLPYILGFFYRGQDFLCDELDKILTTGELDLCGTMWDSLDYAKGVIPPERVGNLNISRLPLKDVSALNKYYNLKFLDMRFEIEDDTILEKIYDALLHFKLIWIHIYSRTGIQCERVYKHICNREFDVQKIYVQTPNYSQAHMKMYVLNQILRESGKSIFFYPSERSNENAAIEKYMKKNFGKNPGMLTAVFELEADERGVLSLNSNNAKATLWNGMSLVCCLDERGMNNEYIDQICRRLESYIPMDDTELSVNFGIMYGGILSRRNQHIPAKLWLTNSYRHGDSYFCKWCMVKYGLNLYKEWILSGEDGAKEFEKELEFRIKLLPDYQKDVRYIRLLGLHCLRELIFWEKGKPQPDNIYLVLSNYKDKAIVFHEQSGDSDYWLDAIYFETVYANRTENLSLGKQLIEDFTFVMQKSIEENEKCKKEETFRWIMQHEQKLYYLLLSDDKEKVLETIYELQNYPYERAYIPVEACKVVYSFYQNGDDIEKAGIDRHLLWNEVWIP